MFESGGVFRQFVPKEKVQEFGQQIRSYAVEKLQYNGEPTFKSCHETAIILAKKL